jgi:hypothetical protein
MDFYEDKPQPKLDAALAKGQTMVITADASVFTDVGRGSYKYLWINDGGRGVYQHIQMEINESNGEIEINLIRLSNEQRLELIRFLQQVK